MATQEDRRAVYSVTRPVVTRLAWREVDQVEEIVAETGEPRSAVLRQLLEEALEARRAKNGQ